MLSFPATRTQQYTHIHPCKVPLEPVHQLAAMKDSVKELPKPVPANDLETLPVNELPKPVQSEDLETLPVRLLVVRIRVYAMSVSI